MKHITLGILAHVDSGKTTLSEAMLYHAGAIRRLGRVDHADAFLDTFALERQRGITIFSKQAVLQSGESEFTLLDTPGHVDFSAEMERTLQVLDYAVLVISGTDGVQSHTRTLWQLLIRYGVPVFVFVNKMDLPGADRAARLAELRLRLDAGCVDFTAPQAERDEELAACDEALMERYLESGSLSDAEIAAAVARRTVFPCYFGSALRLEGVESLLDGLDRLTRQLPAPQSFGAKVFKIAAEDGVRLSYVKITGGVLRVRDTLDGTLADGTPWSEKVTQLRRYSGAKFTPVDEATPGMVVAVAGLTHTRPGDGVGAEPDSERPVLEPVLTYRVELPPAAPVHTALTQLRQLEEEDPTLHIVWNEQLQEIHVQLMGEVQLEILREVIAERFGLAVTFGTGSILYRETIAAPVEGVGHYEPLRHYAEVHLLLRPAPRGSGLHFDSSVHVDDLDLNWQRLILTHLMEKTHLGVLTGSPITDMTITLAAGRAHLKHTEGGDFRQATYRAVRQGLRGAQSILLEPWYRFRLEVPQEVTGRAMTDLQRLEAQFDPPETLGEWTTITGTGPVATLRGYSTEVAAYTRGRGQLSCTPMGYAPCHNAEEVIARLGYDADADLENTAGSVFCAHGAGFNVPWNEVPEHMHLPSVLAPKPSDEPDLNARLAREYLRLVADDNELIRIFERTYGPIRRDRREAVRPRKAPNPDKPYRGHAQPTGPEYLLVDGYNIIFAWDNLAALAREDLNAARQKLMDILCNYQGFRQCKLILVFDAYKVKGNPGSVESYNNISVVYTKEAETADMYIEKVTHRLGRQRRVRVATSDGLEQVIILGHGALRVSASQFRQEVEEAETAIRRLLQGG